MKNVLLVAVVFQFTILSCCKDEPTKPTEYALFSVQAEDVSCTEVYLKVHLGAGYNTRTVKIMRDTVIVMNRMMSETDLMVIDTNLSPNRTYSYTAHLLDGMNVVETVTPFSAHTMDTTSHNFTFQTFTLGDGSGSSCLYDVAIINDTLAYAVGLIYQGGQRYNSAKWNGVDWKLENITVNYRDNLISPPLYGAFAFSASDIWFSSGVPIHGDGQNWTQYHLFDMGILSQSDGSVNKIWGSSSSNIYFVGDLGTIARRGTDGVWRKIESGTTLQFLDIYGSGNEILAVCTQNYPPGKGLFSLQGKIAKEISSNIPSYQLAELFSVWFVPNRHYYIVGDGIYEKFLLTESRWKNNPLDITRYATTKIRGNGLNDIFIVGAYGECLHWNGTRWKSFHNITELSYGSYSGLAVNKSMFIAVGSNYANAVVLVGKIY